MTWERRYRGDSIWIEEMFEGARTDYPRPEGEPDYPNAILVGASGLLDSCETSETDAR